MKIGMLFARMVLIGMLFGGRPVFSSNNSLTQAKLFYEAVVKADVKMVHKMLKSNLSLIDCRYDGGSILGVVLQATVLEKVVSKSKLKDFAEIVGLLGKDAAAFKLRTKDKKCYINPLKYSLLHCYPEIDKALLQFAKKPQGYIPKTGGKKEQIEKMVSLSIGVVVPFLKECLLEAVGLLNQESLKKLVVKEVFDSGIKDVADRPLCWTFGARRLIETVVFSIELYGGKTLLCAAEFAVVQKGSELRVEISKLISPEEERQNGYGRLVLGSLIKAFALVHNKIYISLIAEPQYDDDQERKLYLPYLISFYKSLGLRLHNLADSELFLWIIGGKVQLASEPGALTYLQC